MLTALGKNLKAPRPSISNVIWVLSSDICQLNQFNTKSEAAMLSKMKSRPKKDQKTIFFSVEQFIVKTQFEIPKYLLSIFMSSNICRAILEDLFNSSPKVWRSEGEK